MMTDPIAQPADELHSITGEVLESLADRFPVCCASDEFYYFPQACLENPNWGKWDRFGTDTVSATAGLISVWQRRLDALKGRLGQGPDEIDRRLLLKVIGTLKEQLTTVMPWKTQPTFYLTVAAVGMADALGSPDREAAVLRAQGLAAFLDRAPRALDGVPGLFRDLGLEMAADVRGYFLQLGQNLPQIRPAVAALDRFRSTLKGLRCPNRYQMPLEILETVVRGHLNTGMGISRIKAALETEIAEMRALLARTAAAISANTPWQAIMEKIPLPQVDDRGLIGLYGDCVAQLSAHCVARRLVDGSLARQCPVAVAPVPGYLSATRTASSYSIPPGHPPGGGTFFVLNADDPREALSAYQREYRFLIAHETWPGHHLLDVNRWALKRPLRRVVELPLFYEGWACFAEELVRRSGYLQSDKDLLLLARRRLWRAIRGRVDLGLQTGEMTLETAAGFLAQTGIDIGRARSSARKYTLNPGYQLCYTLGLQRFLALFASCGRNRPQWFVKNVLGQGEIDFGDLEQLLTRSKEQQGE